MLYLILAETKADRLMTVVADSRSEAKAKAAAMLFNADDAPKTSDETELSEVHMKSVKITEIKEYAGDPADGSDDDDEPLEYFSD